MLLAVDIGNTNVVIGIYRGPQLVTAWRLATERAKMPDEWWAILSILAGEEGVDLHDLDGSIMASVVPRLTGVFTEMIERRIGRPPIAINGTMDLGFRVRADNPAEVGADRLANTVAAFAVYGGPAVVVDFGTGTNFDVVSAEGDYLGGAIAPGITLALEALTGRAARLTAVELVVPDHAIGRNTIHSVQSGTVLGYIALVEGLLTRIARELGTEPIVVATGGLGRLIAAHTHTIDAYEPNLTLDGLRILFERLAGTSAPDTSR